MTIARSIDMLRGMVRDLLRRRLLAGVGAALVAAVAFDAWAQDYPSRPIKLVVAFTAGGTTDFVARLLAERLRTSLGQAVIVENRPGANGAIAAEYVAKSEPDGTTLFFTTVGAVAINPALRGNLAYDPLKDFAPVGLAVFNSTMLVVNAAFNAALNDPQLRGKLRQAGVTPSPSSAEEFARYLRDEIARWGKLIREKGIKGE
jgi:tripartite-type tricarboxylate transporter receptor subunit TctC